MKREAGVLFFKDNNRVVGSYSYNFSKNVMFTDRNHDKKKKKRERKIRKIGCVTTALCDIHKRYTRLLIAGDVVKEYLQLK